MYLPNKLMNHKSKLLLLFISSIFISCNGNKNNAQKGMELPATNVTVATVIEEIITGVDHFPGTVVALNETELRAEVSGYITQIYVEDGASVSKGQRLYEIDLTRYVAAEDQAKANLNIAQANLEKVKRDLKRYQTLAEKEAIARQILDNAETDLNNAEAQVSSASAALTTAKTNLNRSVIIAPFSGTIGISQVRKGALVSAGTTLLNTISSVEPIAVDFRINEQELQRFIELQKDPQARKDSDLTLQLSGGSMYPHPGKIVTIDRAVDRSTGTIIVRASFPNKEGLLRAGMNANVLLTKQSAVAQLVIPYKAVFEQLGQPSVYSVSDSNTAVQRVIKLGIKSEDKIVVTEGLMAGEQIVLDGLMNLRPGAKLNIQQQKADTAQ